MAYPPVIERAYRGVIEPRTIDIADISPACALVIAAPHPSPENGGPCATCAFRPNTEPNLSPHTMMLAALCVEGFREFHCHEDRSQLCRGFVAALNVRGELDDDERERADALGEAADILGDFIADAAAAQDRVRREATESR